jgi:hypothetical protein
MIPKTYSMYKITIFSSRLGYYVCTLSNCSDPFFIWMTLYRLLLQCTTNLGKCTFDSACQWVNMSHKPFISMNSTSLWLIPTHSPNNHNVFVFTAEPSSLTHVSFLRLDQGQNYIIISYEPQIHQWQLYLSGNSYQWCMYSK